MPGIEMRPASSLWRTANAPAALRLGGLPDPVGHVDGVEVRVGHKAVHGLEADVVGVHVVRFPPAEGLDGGVRGGAGGDRLGPDREVLAVGLVPDRDHRDALLRGHDAGPELGLGLVRKAVADSE